MVSWVKSIKTFKDILSARLQTTKHVNGARGNRGQPRRGAVQRQTHTHGFKMRDQQKPQDRFLHETQTRSAGRKFTSGISPCVVKETEEAVPDHVGQLRSTTALSPALLLE